jgi:hypothetical protein
MSIPMLLHHGTRHVDFGSFDVQHCVDDRPFGPGVYLTADPLVARCYSGRTGVIYDVCITNDADGALDLNTAWDDQPMRVQGAIIELLNHVDQREVLRLGAPSARESIDLANSVLGKRRRNQFLFARGVWLLYGYLTAMERSGLGDRSIQYVVLHQSCITSFEPHVSIGQEHDRITPPSSGR